MDQTTGTSESTNVAVTQAAGQFNEYLAAVDESSSAAVTTLGLVHQARLSQASRTAAALADKYGVNDARVKAAQAAVAATQTTIAQVSVAGRQLAMPAVKVSKNGWAIQGLVLGPKSSPLAKYTVFLADANGLFQREVGLAYTDASGYFLLNYAGTDGEPQDQETGGPDLYLSLANPKGKPAYVSKSAFKPTLGAATTQHIVLASADQTLGDPSPAVREVALPEPASKAGRSKPAPASNS